jgi:EAL domain-containing protein (putative c-di-GMP-specific phosphodiesterase class I)
MNLSVVDSYLEQKIKHIAIYTNILLKSIYQTKPDNIRVLDQCIIKYVETYVLNDDKIDDVKEKVKTFYSQNDIIHDKQKKIIAVFFEVMPRLEQAIKDETLLKDIIVLSQILTFAVDLEENTTPIVEGKLTYNKAIVKINKEYYFLKEKQLKKAITLAGKELRETVNENIRFHQKLSKLMHSDSFDLHFYNLYDLKRTPNKFFEVSLRYNLKGLKKYSSDRVNSVVDNSGLIVQHTTMLTEMLVLLLYKSLLRKKRYGMFFLRIPDKFFEDKINIDMLLRTTSIKEIKNKICLIVNYKQLDKNQSAILKLKNEGFCIAMDDLIFSENIEEELKRVVDYVVVDKQVKMKKSDLIKISEEKKVEIIRQGNNTKAILLSL